ncbi:LPS export ABC transporter periplasmic protein LptC [Thermosynechococcaceae cyanobacterium BACA0444]|uniref:LPS export ABC transporter periplasmic protein LptC n=1 Tax=Pseudocalidococcus azoricus BACA0444 TaxID=2918990 RepID=A0AAE4FUQ9_9CYAN|nr:LPS export ABC transporter periplasmic protein LptC [Pseudocalidococcus azoricus]MDS3861396.1 LPS export ABC transporter periplasmic protein LptC [Pseudocalidococcus azoricus BACA0444]
MLLVTGLVGALAGCHWGQSTSTTDSPIETEVEGGVKFRNLVLRQTNPKGELLWKIQAETATYSPDRKVAHLKNVQGELLNAGKPVYKLTTPQARVQQQQTQLILNGPVRVQDLRNQVVLVGREFIWQPNQNQLLARQNPQIRYPKITLTAKEITANSKTQQVRAQQNVQVVSQRPDFQDLQLTAQVLLWNVNEAQLIAGSLTNQKLRGVEVKRIKGPNMGERAVGAELAWNLTEKVLTLREQAQVNLVNPDVQVAGNALMWRVEQQEISSQAPLQIFSPSQTLTAQAQAGRMDLAQERVELRGQVQLNRTQNPAQLNADQLTWFLPTQKVNALGNVFYQQQTPFLRVKGTEAVGWLDKQEVIVSGRVQTQVIPVQ